MTDSLWLRRAASVHVAADSVVRLRVVAGAGHQPDGARPAGRASRARATVGMGSSDTIVTSGLRIVGIDRPGYALSAPEPGRTIAGRVPEALAVADHLGIDRCPSEAALRHSALPSSAEVALDRSDLGGQPVGDAGAEKWMPAHTGRSLPCECCRFDAVARRVDRRGRCRRLQGVRVRA